MQSDSPARTERSVGSSSFRKVAVIGAGVMGREIALATLRAGISVTIYDANTETAAESVRQIREATGSALLRGPHFTSRPACPVISLASSEAQLTDAELLIEAVTEKEQIKTEILARVESSLHEHTILTSNSSSIPITRLASALQNPGRLCGLHFCHPVSERPLVEVIRAEQTASDTVNRASTYVRSLGLSPIVLNDRPGFLLNRMLVPYLNEALELLLEGVDPKLLDRAAREFGFPVGPLRHIDEFGIDVAVAVGRTLYWTFPDRIVPSELLIAMYKAGWHGCKSGGGFYPVDDIDVEKGLRPEVLQMIDERRRTNQSPSHADVTVRLFLPLLLEAMRAWEESYVEDPRVIDFALKNGLGMTSVFQGLWNWGDALGTRQILNYLESYAGLGGRFEPTPRLRELAARDASLVED